MRLSVRHRTYFQYAVNASQSINQICLIPRSTDQQRTLQSLLQVTPQPPRIDSRLDQYGNTLHTFNLHQPHDECDIVVTSMVETSDSPRLPINSEPARQNQIRLDSMRDAEAMMALDCLLPSPSIPIDDAINTIITELPAGDLPVLDYADQLMQHIYTTFTYESGFSTLITPLADIVQARKGVCQDFAHLAIGVLRAQGIPARYVSGYLETLPPPGQEKLQGADASHAWYSVFAADHGWYDFDPTNNKRPDTQYVTTAWGRDYADVTPVKGVVYGGGKHKLSVEVDVNRVEVSCKLVTKE